MLALLLLASLPGQRTAPDHLAAGTLRGLRSRGHARNQANQAGGTSRPDNAIGRGRGAFCRTAVDPGHCHGWSLASPEPNASTRKGANIRSAAATARDAGAATASVDGVRGRTLGRSHVTGT